MTLWMDEIVFGESPRWHDGRPVTPADVVFSFETLKAQSPLYAFYYKNVAKAETTAEREVTFRFDEKGNRELPQIVGQLVVLDFAMCRLSDAMARRMLGEKARLSAIDELWISSTHVSKPAFDIFTLIPRRLVDPPPEPVDVRLRAIDRARYANTWE